MRRIERKQRPRTIRAAKTGRAIDAIGRLAPGCEIYLLTFGQFSLIDALMAILQSTGPAHVIVSTWTAAHAHLDIAAGLLASADILSMRYLVDRSFLTRQPQYCARMRELFGDQCIRTCRTHAKFMAIYNEAWNIGVRTSMNLNENPRLENIEISDDAELCDFLRKVTDDIFSEHQQGDFAAAIPDLHNIETVSIPGISAKDLTWRPADATTGRTHEPNR